MPFTVGIETMPSIHQATSDFRGISAALADAMYREPSAMFNEERPFPAVATSRRLRLGFVPLNDSAPIVMAAELGLFKKYDLQVQLSREPGWATIRDKIIYGELNAAHALAAMPIAATLGWGSIACPALAALVLNLNGNAITLSTTLRKRGVHDVRTLRQVVLHDRGRKSYTFGVVSQFSSHMFLLRQWLTGGGIDPERDVRIVVVPPPQMYPNLRAGNLDGYCVGEPWNSVAVQNEVGWCAATSCQLAPYHPEKVLMVRADFASAREGEHLALIAALIEACAFCDDPANREQVAMTLSRPNYVNAPIASVRGGLIDQGGAGDRAFESMPDFTVFHRYNTNEPTAEKVAWIVNQLLRSDSIGERFDSAAVSRVFRPDIFHQAIQLLNRPYPHETNSKIERQVALTEA